MAGRYAAMRERGSGRTTNLLEEALQQRAEILREFTVNLEKVDKALEEKGASDPEVKELLKKLDKSKDLLEGKLDDQSIEGLKKWVAELEKIPSRSALGKQLRALIGKAHETAKGEASTVGISQSAQRISELSEELAETLKENGAAAAAGKVSSKISIDVKTMFVMTEDIAKTITKVRIAAKGLTAIKNGEGLEEVRKTLKEDFKKEIKLPAAPTSTAPSAPASTTASAHVTSALMVGAGWIASLDEYGKKFSWANDILEGLDAPTKKAIEDKNMTNVQAIAVFKALAKEWRKRTGIAGSPSMEDIDRVSTIEEAIEIGGRCVESYLKKIANGDNVQIKSLYGLDDDELALLMLVSGTKYRSAHEKLWSIYGKIFKKAHGKVLSGIPPVPVPPIATTGGIVDLAANPPPAPPAAASATS